MRSQSILEQIELFRQTRRAELNILENCHLISSACKFLKRINNFSSYCVNNVGLNSLMPGFENVLALAGMEINFNFSD